MFIERLIVKNFRHIRDAEFGPFREAINLSELIVLAGPNGGGKSSILELLSFGLTHRYSWQYYSSRNITGHSFAIKIGLSNTEIEQLAEDTEDHSVLDYARVNKGYWIQVNHPDIIAEDIRATNEKVHGLVSRRFQNFTRKLGFFIRSDRGYGKRDYNRKQIFNWKNKLKPQHFNSISYQSTSQQYQDMYDFLVEQSYHYIFEMGRYSLDIEGMKPSVRPIDPIQPYNELLGKLFPNYSFVEESGEDLSLRVKLPAGDVIPFHELSSGEKEVFFILSFFIRHDISDSVIIIDEPELHLHPELARNLIRLMRTIRPRNQIWCGTHSAELVDEAGRERTFFLRATEDKKGAECIPATKEGAELQILRDMFGYSGYVGISRKVVFLEGKESSADRKTFTNLFPELSREVRLIPVGTATNLYRINQAVLALLEADFARCEFYLIRDRDYLSKSRVEKHLQIAPNRLFVLSRYHIENYLLDENVISDLMKTIFDKELTPDQVRDDLRTIARENSASFLRDLVVSRLGELYQSEDCSIGNHSTNMSALLSNGEINLDVVQPLKIALINRASEVSSDVTQRISTASTEKVVDDCLDEVKEAFRNGSEGWKTLFPGRYLLKRFSTMHNLGDWPALQNLIIEHLGKGGYQIDTELSGIFTKIVVKHPPK